MSTKIEKKETKEMQLPKPVYYYSDNETRLNISIDDDVKKRFQKFNKEHKGGIALHASIALSRYMDAIENNEIFPVRYMTNPAEVPATNIEDIREVIMDIPASDQS